jgi:hypothetical protein
MRRFFFLPLILTVMLTACSGGSDGASAKVVEQYLAAMVSGNTDQMTQLVCKEFEEQAAGDVDAFIGVTAELSEMSCAKTGSDGEVDLVGCTGSILATYGNEQQTFDLAGPVYRVIEQSGSWLICGRQ